MLAIIGGSGLYQLKGMKVSSCKDYSTPFGVTSGPISLGQFCGQSVAFMPRHGQDHNMPPHLINYRANLFALKELGVDDIIAVNAVGGITEGCLDGQLVVPDQIIDYSYGREHTYFDGTDRLSSKSKAFDLCVGHVDFSYPYDESVRQELVSACANLNIPCVSEATYGCTQGPRLESAAEIGRLANDGCDIVGMTAMPEAALARELELAYGSICLVVNPAAGCGDDEISMDHIEAVLKMGMGKIERLLDAVVDQRL